MDKAVQPVRPKRITRATGITRKNHKKSKLGCQQCRKRRVKCDESLPVCNSCLTRSMRCSYLDLTREEIHKIQESHRDPSKYPFQKYHYFHTIKEEHTHQDVNKSHDEERTDNYFINDFGQNNYINQNNNQNNIIVSDQYSQEPPLSQYLHPHPEMIAIPYQPTLPPPAFVEQPNYYEGSNYDNIPNINTDYGKTILESNTGDNLNNNDNDNNNNNNSNKNKNNDDDNDDDELHPISSLWQKLKSLQLEDSSTTVPSIRKLSYQEPEYLLNKNTGNYSFELLLVPHYLDVPILSLKTIPEFFHETIPMTLTRLFLLKRVHSQTKTAFHNIQLFNALLLKAAGSLLSLKPDLDSYYLTFKGRCMKYVLDNINNFNDENGNDLLMSITILNVSSIYEQLTKSEHFTLSSGPPTLLKIFCENPSEFDKSFKELKGHADGLLYTSKFSWMPQYDSDVLVEFDEVVDEFAKIYLEDPKYCDDHDIILDQFDSMIDIIESALNIDTPGYPVSSLLTLLQKWHGSLPSECFTLSSTTKPIEKVFYVFWYTLASIITNMYPGGRYIFTYFLDGYLTPYVFNKDVILKNISDPKLLWFLHYSFRIIAFFNRRMAFILNNNLLNDEEASFYDVTKTNRLEPTKFEKPEICIKSFRTTLIKKLHFRVLNEVKKIDDTTKINNSNIPDHRHSDKKSKKASVDLDYSSDENSPNSRSSFQETPVTIETTEDDEEIEYNLKQGTLEDVDLLNNFNTETSMLNNDYDPRLNESLFINTTTFQPAGLDFINVYILERKIIQKGPD